MKTTLRFVNNIIPGLKIDKHCCVIEVDRQN